MKNLKLMSKPPNSHGCFVKNRKNKIEQTQVDRVNLGEKN